MSLEIHTWSKTLFPVSQGSAGNGSTLPEDVWISSILLDFNAAMGMVLPGKVIPIFSTYRSAGSHSQAAAILLGECANSAADLPVNPTAGRLRWSVQTSARWSQCWRTLGSAGRAVLWCAEIGFGLWSQLDCAGWPGCTCWEVLPLNLLGFRVYSNKWHYWAEGGDQQRVWAATQT